MAQTFPPNALLLASGRWAAVATFSLSISIPWCKDEADLRRSTPGRLFAHRVAGGSGNFSSRHRRSLHAARLFSAALPDRIAGFDFLSGSAACPGSDRAIRSGSAAEKSLAA